ncbi:MAG: S-layer homology domain-containing protein, partial [Clostridia bacterium]|nr:S-layer homology domain-containing protein [Clostridia bacterium]
MKKFIAMLMTAAMLTASVFQTVSFAAFSDVSEDHQYKNAITTLSTLSVIAGYEDGT